MMDLQNCSQDTDTGYAQGWLRLDPDHKQTWHLGKKSCFSAEFSTYVLVVEVASESQIEEH
jgi:hypothetical protein